MIQENACKLPHDLDARALKARLEEAEAAAIKWRLKYEGMKQHDEWLERCCKKLEAVAVAIREMKANLICDRLWDGTLVHGWYTVAPCEYGEAVDAALAALDAKEGT